MPTYQKLNKYGQTRTLVDIVKVLNEKSKYTDVHALIDDFGKVVGEYEKRGTVDKNNSYCNERFIDLEDISIDTIPHVYFTKSMNRGKDCKCSNYLYKKD